MLVWNLKKYIKFYIVCVWNVMNIDIKESGNVDFYCGSVWVWFGILWVG